MDTEHLLLKSPLQDQCGLETSDQNARSRTFEAAVSKLFTLFQTPVTPSQRSPLPVPCDGKDSFSNFCWELVQSASPVSGRNSKCLLTRLRAASSELAVVS